MERNWAELVFKQRDYLHKIKPDIERMILDPCETWGVNRTAVDTTPDILILFKGADAVQAFIGTVEYVALSDEQCAVRELDANAEWTKWRIVEEEEVPRMILRYATSILEYFERMAEVQQ
jgi:hypothetical protein